LAMKSPCNQSAWSPYGFSTATLSVAMGVSSSDETVSVVG
jgi:hypothetical protein